MAAHPLLSASRTPRPTRWHHAGWSAVGAIALCLVSSAAARADVPPRAFDRPEPAAAARSAPLPLRIDRDRRAQHHRLVIPAHVLAALGKAKSGDTTTSSTQFRSIVAAVALSAAVAAGLVIGRSRQRTSGQRRLLALCGLVSLAAVAFAASPVFADLLPPGGGPRPPRAVPPGRDGDADDMPAAGTIVLEIAPEGDEIVLFVGRNGLPPR